MEFTASALLLCVSMTIASSSFAQWTTSSNHIYNSNTGNLGIGTSAPAFKWAASGGFGAPRMPL